MELDETAFAPANPAPVRVLQGQGEVEGDRGWTGIVGQLEDFDSDPAVNDRSDREGLVCGSGEPLEGLKHPAGMNCRERAPRWRGPGPQQEPAFGAYRQGALVSALDLHGVEAAGEDREKAAVRFVPRQSFLGSI